MLETIAIALTVGVLLADTTGQQKSQPRQLEPPGQQQKGVAGTPTDPLFDRQMVATDDPTFIRNAIETSRQGVFDARAATTGLTPPLRGAAESIELQYGATLDKLQRLAQRKGWPLPNDIPERAPTVQKASAVRMNADFIVSQIAVHEETLRQYRAQIAGTKDAELKRTLRDAIAGYEKNRDLLLTLNP
jgi:hypothetical protein